MHPRAGADAAQVVFSGSAGEVHKQALDVMGHVEWVILQADLLVPSDALLAASTRHGTHLAVVLTNEQHLLEFEPALARTLAQFEVILISLT